jgi:hypothetical protein
VRREWSTRSARTARRGSSSCPGAARAPCISVSCTLQTGRARPPDARELRVQERHVEGRVVDQELGAVDELEELVDDVGEARLVGEVLGRHAVHLGGREVDGALRVEEAVEVAPGGAAPVSSRQASSMMRWPSAARGPWSRYRGRFFSCQRVDSLVGERVGALVAVVSRVPFTQTH